MVIAENQNFISYNIGLSLNASTHQRYNAIFKGTYSIYVQKLYFIGSICDLFALLITNYIDRVFTKSRQITNMTISSISLNVFAILAMGN